MTIEVPNTHAVWDPPWAIYQVAKHFTPQLELGSKVTRYGANLLMRALETAPPSRAYHVVLTVLLRQAVAAFDAVVITLRNGAPGAASTHIRGLMEARWGLMHALSDIPKWGSHIYVASLRENRHWASRLVPGTAEHTAFHLARALIESTEPTSPAMIEDARQAIAALDLKLAEPDCLEANKEMEAGLAHLRHDPPWYYDATVPKPQRLVSIRRLAKRVGALAEYDTIYKQASYNVHGGFTGTHLKADPAGTAIAPLRTPEGFNYLFLCAVSLIVDVYRRVIEQYRPGELLDFRNEVGRTWLPVTRAAPDLEVSLGLE